MQVNNFETGSANVIHGMYDFVYVVASIHLHNSIQIET